MTKFVNLNFQDKNFKEVLYFVTKALFISAIFIFTYNLTIGITIKKIEDRVEGIDNFIVKTGIYNIISKTNHSESEKNRIRNNTLILLENLSPVIDEILLYDFNQTSVQLNE